MGKSKSKRKRRALGDELVSKSSQDTAASQMQSLASTSEVLNQSRIRNLSLRPARPLNDVKLQSTSSQATAESISRSISAQSTASCQYSCSSSSSSDTVNYVEQRDPAELEKSEDQQELKCHKQDEHLRRLQQELVCSRESLEVQKRKQQQVREQLGCLSQMQDRAHCAAQKQLEQRLLQQLESARHEIVVEKKKQQELRRQLQFYKKPQQSMQAQPTACPPKSQATQEEDKKETILNDSKKSALKYGNSLLANGKNEMKVSEKSESLLLPAKKVSISTQRESGYNENKFIAPGQKSAPRKSSDNRKTEILTLNESELDTNDTYRKYSQNDFLQGSSEVAEEAPNRRFCLKNCCDKRKRGGSTSNENGSNETNQKYFPGKLPENTEWEATGLANGNGDEVSTSTYSRYECGKTAVSLQRPMVDKAVNAVNMTSYEISNVMDSVTLTATQTYREPAFQAPYLRNKPCPFVCPCCHRRIVTITVRRPSKKTHIVACILCGMCLWPCACLPYCLECFSHTRHYCPCCRSYLGTFYGTNRVRR